MNKSFVKYFVSYSLAVKLKEKGYNETPFGYYIDAVPNNVNRYSGNDKEWFERCEREGSLVAAPLYQQVIDWLGERKIFLSVKHYTSGNYSFEIQTHNGDATGWTKRNFMEKTSFDYYESLNEGIKEALKLL